jgi:hypothetical protein
MGREVRASPVLVALQKGFVGLGAASELNDSLTSGLLFRLHIPVPTWTGAGNRNR